MQLPLDSARVWTMTRGDADMHALQEVCKTWQFWDFDAVIAMLDRPVCRGYFAALSASAPWLGLMLVDIGLDTADLLYLYVQPQERRRGLANLMITGLVQNLRKQPQLSALLLEVRPTNLAARQLYEQFGFAEAGVRRRYYNDGEDALVLRLALNP